MPWVTFRPPPTETTPMTIGKPAAEIEIDAALVRALLQDQHPDLADLPIEHFAGGWDNAMFRLGDALTVRLPRRQIAAQLVLNEQAWLADLQPLLPIPIPAPLRTGSPAATYPWHWSVLPWFEGSAADLTPPTAAEATRLAEFLLALHQPAPPTAPLNDVRGIPIAQRSAQVAERLTRLREKTDLVTSEVARIWEVGLAAPRSTAMMWLHGDLHSQNVLVERDTGKITAIIDWGDITSGDIATDLAAFWLLFEDRSARERALQIYGPDQATLDRAKAWAVLFAAVLLDSGLINNPRHAAIGLQAFQRISEDG